MDSLLRTRGVQPFWQQTWATRAKVQVERCLPKARGRRWSNSRKGSSKARSRSGRALLGREDFAFRQASPSPRKAWKALRTDGAVQPRWRAIRAGLWPAALANRI